MYFILENFVKLLNTLIIIIKKFHIYKAFLKK